MNYVIGVSRNNSVDSASNQQQSNGLRTFRPGPAAAKNLTGSPSRAAPPNLADLDFPPPPTELPPELPPPAERRPPIPSSPRAVRAEKPLPQVPYSFLPFHVRSIFVGTYIWKVTGKKACLHWISVSFVQLINWFKTDSMLRTYYTNLSINTMERSPRFYHCAVNGLTEWQTIPLLLFSLSCKS